PLDVPGVRAQGAVSHHFGANLSDATIRAFAAVSTTVVTEAINDSGAASSSHPQKGTARRHRVVARLVLDRAEQLLVTFNATQTAARSRVLRSGFAARVNQVATALHECLTAPDGDSIRRLAAAVDRLDDHHLAGVERHRVERARMALRLARWAKSPVAHPESVTDGIQRHIDEWGWVDRAHHNVWSGDDADPSLQAAYRDLCAQVQERRKGLDRAFANRLAAWTDSGAPAGKLLTVESLLARVVSPVVHGTDRSALLVILDGMSVAAASELAEGLEQDGWVEYDPVAGDGQPHRRGVVAALPTITEVSRASLLAGELCAGDKHDEKRYFERQSLWRGKPAMIFHDSDVHGGAGEVITPALEEALGHTDTLVSVVLNTIDDTLGPGREGNEPGWRLDNIKSLRLLLQRAGYHGRAVVITSDHGHILEQQGTLQRAPDSISARHRSGAAPPGTGEVLLRGDRVVADGQRVVALWDTSMRYQRIKGGYHGGASLAEVTVPLLAYLPGGATAPKGWETIAPARPPWWDAPYPAPSPATPSPPATPPRQASPQGRRRPPAPTGDTLFDIPASTPAVGSGSELPAGDQSASAASCQAGALVAELLESEMFVEQSNSAARRMAQQKIAKAVTALLDAGGGLPLAVLAERAGEQVARAHGFATTLQRILNVDNFPVLSIVDNGRTARLDPVLLRQQFGLSGTAR
ncbi:MAG: BREX-2 system phosphatase PglZ, partial [Micromonosporaceae bacterium]